MSPRFGSTTRILERMARGEGSKKVHVWSMTTAGYCEGSMPSYRQQIEAAREQWRKGFLGIGGLFRSKSQTSRDGDFLLGSLMHMNPAWDDELERAVGWLLGTSDAEYRLGLLPDRRFQRLNQSSKLYVCLTAALLTADPPRRAPVVSRTSRSTPHASASRRPASHQASSSSGARLAAPVIAPPQVSSSSAAASSTSSRREDHVALALSRWRSEWAGIEITDLPTATPGVYTYTEYEPVATMQESGAAGAVRSLQTDQRAKKVTEVPEFWLKLGHMVMGSKIGKCFSCSAAAIYSIVMTDECDGLVVVAAGAPDYDHHFVLLGTPKAIEEGNESALYVVDVWDSVASKGSRPSIVPWSSYRYKSSTKPKIFAILHVEDRARHRRWAQKLGKPQPRRI